MGRNVDGTMSVETKKRRKANREALRNAREGNVWIPDELGIYPDDWPTGADVTNTYIILQCPPMGGQLLLDFLKHHNVKPYMVVTGTDQPMGANSFIRIPPLPTTSRATDEEALELGYPGDIMVEVHPHPDLLHPAAIPSAMIPRPYPARSNRGAFVRALQPSSIEEEMVMRDREMERVREARLAEELRAMNEISADNEEDLPW